MDLPHRLTWLKSGRFLRAASALLAAVILTALLYNAILVDRIPPTFTMRLSSTSSGGAAMTLASIEIDFSEPVKQETAEAAFAIVPPIAGSRHWQGSTMMIFTPASKLPLSTSFHVRMAAGVQDLAGNVQQNPADFAFSTVGPPKVASVAPIENQDSVPVESDIVITFDRRMDPERVLAGLRIQPGINYQASWTDTVLTINPTTPLDFGTLYTVEITNPAVDTDGTPLGTFATTFRTVGIGLRATGLVPAPNVAGVSIFSQVAVTFDGPIDPDSVAGAITLTPTVSGTSKAVSFSGDVAASSASPAASAPASQPKILLFTPDSPLAPHTTYTVTMSSTVQRADRTGQVAASEHWSFTTGEASPSALNQIAFISARSGVANVWLMNPDGSNQRQITSELQPVSGFDLSGDGVTLVYGAGGVVKKMDISGRNLTTVTPAGDFEYAPVLTPDDTGLVVGRRDAAGRDLGYWRYPLAGGGEPRQLTSDGAPPVGSSGLTGVGLSSTSGLSAWAGRTAMNPPGTMMLTVRGSDDVIELVDLSGAKTTLELGMVGNSRPVYVAQSDSFYVTGSTDSGTTWSLFQIKMDGTTTRLGASSGDLASLDQGQLAVLIPDPTGASHLSIEPHPGGLPQPLTTEASLTEASPSVSPDGSVLVFGRVSTGNPSISAGIWIVRRDGSGLTALSTDGAFPRWVP